MKPSNLTRYLELTDAVREPILVTGRPGIGKSDIVEAAMSAVGRRVIARAIHAAAQWLSMEHVFGLLTLAACLLLLLSDIARQWPRNRP